MGHNYCLPNLSFRISVRYVSWICVVVGAYQESLNKETSRNRYLSLHHMQTDSGAQPVSGYEVNEWGLIPSRDRNFSFHHHMQTGSGVQPITVYDMGDRGLIPSRDRKFSLFHHMRTDSGAHSVTDNEVDDWGFILSRNGDFSFHHRIQTRSGTHLVSYPVNANSFWK